MTKYRPYSSREFRRLFAEWAGRNLKRLLLLAVFALGLVAFPLVLVAFAFPATSFTWWFIGVCQAIVVAAFLHLLHASFLAHDPAAIRHLRGGWGEDNTRDELKRAKRKKLIWGCVDSISLQAGDVDHLVVTRRGGLVAIDTKWRNQVNDRAEMAMAANKARVRAEGLARTLLKSDRDARHRAKVNPLKVTPLVVLWGSAQHDMPDSARVEDVDFVGGRRLLAWLAALDGEPVDKAAAADVVERLERYRAETWHNTKPTPQAERSAK